MLVLGVVLITVISLPALAAVVYMVSTNDLAFLSSWLPDPGTTNHFYNFTLRLARGLNLPIGTICLIASLCWGVWIIWNSITF